MKKLSRITLIMVLVFVIGGCRWIAPSPSATGTPQPTKQANLPIQRVDVQSPAPAQPAPMDVPTVVDKISPAVVGLTVQGIKNEMGETVNGLGTGFIVHPDGYVVTNNHVVGGAQSVEAVMMDGTRKGVDVLWRDESMDLAVCKITGGGTFPFVELSDSSTLRVGQQVVAIGTPLALQFQHTVTEGIVSALNRTLTVPSGDTTAFMEELIQIDASINPGNSGGPLCDLNGQVVGINTLKVTEAEGIGFSLPIELVKPIVDKIIQNGKYEAPYIGIFAIDAQIARYYGEQVQEGIYVVSLDGNGPAGNIGLQKGSNIKTVDGVAVSTLVAFRKVMYTKAPGDTMELAWQNPDGSSQKATIKLTSKK